MAAEQVFYIVYDDEYPASESILKSTEKELEFNRNYFNQTGTQFEKQFFVLDRNRPYSFLLPNSCISVCVCIFIFSLSLSLSHFLFLFISLCLCLCLCLCLILILSISQEFIGGLITDLKDLDLLQGSLTAFN